MRDKVFSKKEFIASVTENVKTMYRKTLKEATQQEIYQAVSIAKGWRKLPRSSFSRLYATL